MEITGTYKPQWVWQDAQLYSGAFINLTAQRASGDGSNPVRINGGFDFKASRSWTGSTSSASSYTTAMGSGTAITINPEHITIKAWKRLS